MIKGCVHVLLSDTISSMHLLYTLLLLLQIHYHGLFIVVGSKSNLTHKLPLLLHMVDKLFCSVSLHSLEDLKRRVREARLTSPLFDTKLYTRNLEKLFFRMWLHTSKGLPPDHITQL